MNPVSFEIPQLSPSRRRSFGGFESKPLRCDFRFDKTATMPRRELIRLNSEKSLETTGDDASSVLAPRTLKEGWVYVRVGKSAWTRRYARLYVGRLEWYQSPGSEYGVETFMFHPCHRVERVRDREDALTLKIFPTPEPMRISVDNVNDVEDWIVAIERAVDLTKRTSIEDEYLACPDLRDASSATVSSSVSATPPLRSSRSKTAMLLRTMSSTDEEADKDEIEAKEQLRNTIYQMDLAGQEMKAARDLETKLIVIERTLCSSLERAQMDLELIHAQLEAQQMELQRLFRQKLMAELQSTESAGEGTQADANCQIVQHQLSIAACQAAIGELNTRISSLKERYLVANEDRLARSEQLIRAKTSFTDLEKRMLHFDHQCNLLRGFRRGSLASMASLGSQRRFSQTQAARGSAADEDEDSDDLVSVTSPLDSNDPFQFLIT